MAHRLLEGAAWAAAALLALVAAGLWWSPAPPEPPAEAFPASPVEIASPLDVGRLRASGAVLRDGNPFRLDRSPTDVRFGTEPAPAAEPEAPEPESEPPAPDLALRGIVGGRPWGALIEGVPGTERGILLLVGEERGGILLEELRGDTAIVSADGATWTLAPRRAWRR